MDQVAAEGLGVQALIWLSAQEELLPVFLGSTGLAAEDIRTRATDRDFLASVLEFLTLDDAWVIAFCAAQNCPNDMPLRARYVLSGEAGAAQDWG